MKLLLIQSVEQIEFWSEFTCLDLSIPTFKNLFYKDMFSFGEVHKIIHCHLNEWYYPNLKKIMLYYECVIIFAFFKNVLFDTSELEFLA